MNPPSVTNRKMQFEYFGVDSDSWDETDYDTAVDLCHSSGGHTEITLKTSGGLLLVVRHSWMSSHKSYMEPDFDHMAETGDTVWKHHSSDEPAEHSGERYAYAVTPDNVQLIPADRHTLVRAADVKWESLRTLRDQLQCGGIPEDCEYGGFSSDLVREVFAHWENSRFSAKRIKGHKAWFDVPLTDFNRIRQLEVLVEEAEKRNLMVRIENTFTVAKWSLIPFGVVVPFSQIGSS